LSRKKAQKAQKINPGKSDWNRELPVFFAVFAVQPQKIDHK